MGNLKKWYANLPSAPAIKNPPANAGNMAQSLVQEDSTLLRATKPTYHNYWASALEPVLHNKRSHYNGKPGHSNEDLGQPKINESK